MKLVRLASSDAYATRGQLLRDDGSVIVPATLEPAPPDIPAGSYPCRRYLSPHFGYELFRLYEVPGHDAIEIHKGNLPKDTHGCILVGSQFGDLWTHNAGEPEKTEPGILGSKPAFDALMQELVGVNEFTLSVEDVPEGEE